MFFGCVFEFRRGSIEVDNIDKEGKVGFFKRIFYLIQGFGVERVWAFDAKINIAKRSIGGLNSRAKDEGAVTGVVEMLVENGDNLLLVLRVQIHEVIIHDRVEVEQFWVETGSELIVDLI